MEYSGLVDEDCGAAAAFGTMGGELAAGDVIEELLMEGCWVEASENNYLMGMQQAPQYMGGEGEHFNQQIDQCESGNFVVGKRWWIGPRANPGPSSSVKERLVVAVGYLKEYTKNTNVLIQIWVPLRRRGLHNHYHYHSANPVDEESIPVGNFPNPNVNVQVRFYRSHEYHRVQAQQYGSLALPVFERGSGTCLGVVEIVMTNQTPINYRPQLDHLSNALQGVDFRTSSHNHNHHNHNHHHHQNMLTPAGGVKVFEELYEAAVSEIMEVLASVCKTHNLPLALTWAPCIQQGKGGCGGVSNSTSISCVSTVDSACFLGDVDVLGFQEACYEYHLFHGQGIVGTAFTTTKPCFAIDITAFSKAEYPLANHAKLFGLHAAVAIPLRSVYTGSAADFVLEFFLPKECRDPEEQKHMLNSLSLVVQQACRSLHLHVVMEDDYALPLPPPTHTQQQQLQVDVHDACSNSKESSSCSWIAHMMEAQHKGKGVSVSLEYLQEPKEEFKVTTNWERDTTTTVFADFGGQVMEQSSNSRASVSVDGGEESAGGGGSGRRSSSSGGRKSGDKRRTKAEKTISLPVLRQYFAGSLKDAAKSIGVCPTTLKRICRQHGITRWPSRKIKKVGHSLKKLQLVIDSVQGAEGAIQIGSFYASFPELSTATAPSSSDHNNNNNNSSCFSACSFAANHNGGDHHMLMTENQLAPETLMLRRAHSEADQLHASIMKQEEDAKQYLNNASKRGMSTTSGWNSSVSPSSSQLERGGFRVKATFMDEKIRFSLQAVWCLRDLQVEIARRFNLNDMSNLVLKYLDDEGEWVVLGCDADVEECKDLHRSSQTRTIRLSLFQASPLNTC